MSLVVQGDINGDGYVNFIDVGLLKEAMWSQVGTAPYVPEADIDNNGQVNFDDLAKLNENFGGTRAFLRVYSTQVATTDLAIMAFDRWGSEARITARIGNGNFIVIYP